MLAAFSFFSLEETFQSNVPRSSISLEEVAELIWCSERSSIQQRRFDANEGGASLDKAIRGTVAANAKLPVK